jgi:hypothetical protein
MGACYLRLKLLQYSKLIDYVIIIMGLNYICQKPKMTWIITYLVIKFVYIVHKSFFII